MRSSALAKILAVIVLMLICGCSSGASADIDDVGPALTSTTSPEATTSSVPATTITGDVQSISSSSSTTGVPNNVTTTMQTPVPTTATPSTSPPTTAPPIPESSTTIPFPIETVEPDHNNYETVSPSGT